MGASDAFPWGTVALSIQGNRITCDMNGRCSPHFVNANRGDPTNGREKEAKQKQEQEQKPEGAGRISLSPSADRFPFHSG